MGIQKPTIPKGTRDFSPVEMMRRNFIFRTIEEVFQRYGYTPIETPAMETLQTLMGKYGDEGDKLIFKILNSGDFLNHVPASDQAVLDAKHMTPFICEKALRYDLTVPFARYVVQHQNEITFPFKRYQLQPVWRADRPQKGRYREFFQCDVDVIGSSSLINEVELIQIMDEVFEKLGINIIIKLNNRKVLSGIANIIGEAARITDITVAIDKLEKIGIESVNEELRSKGTSLIALGKLQPILQIAGTAKEKIARLKEILASSAIGLKGIEEIESIFYYSKNLKIKTPLEFDLTLARGLNYYTGAIFEVKAQNIDLGSVCGGGRYDDLTGIFGLPDMPGVGVSFGADRIYDVMNELQLFPEETQTSSKVMFVNFGDHEEQYSLLKLSEVRNAGINAEIYPDKTKVSKQMDYANKKQIPFVIIAGSDEMNDNMLTLKNMKTGDQKKLTIEQLIVELKK